jgi:predicted transcriptional regulator
MSRDVISCYEDDDLESAAKIMEEQQIRRLMVCDHNDQPVGMLSQADIARALGRAPLTGEMLRNISEPGGQHTQHH